MDLDFDFEPEVNTGDIPKQDGTRQIPLQGKIPLQKSKLSRLEEVYDELDAHRATRGY